MIWLHLYDADGNWVAQFRSIEAIEAYAVANELNLNDFTIRHEPSRYPS